VRLAAERARFYERLAMEDTLTGLPNRRAFEQAAARALSARPLRTGVLTIDVDRFKHINDTWSHETGDQALQAVAAMLRAAVGADGTAARLAGDEFVVLVEAADARALDVVARRVRAAGAAVPLRAGGSDAAQVITLSISVGAAHAAPGEALAALLRRGDLAMYEDKAARRRTTPAAAAPTTALHAPLDGV